MHLAKQKGEGMRMGVEPRRQGMTAARRRCPGRVPARCRHGCGLASQLTNEGPCTSPPATEGFSAPTGTGTNVHHGWQGRAPRASAGKASDARLAREGPHALPPARERAARR
uniref:Uncharacterized protein n=1 Tax=Arundo donax TaxID=35708 RepID=A0A0A8XNW8_ARUDO